MVQTLPVLGWNCEVVTWNSERSRSTTTTNGLRVHSVSRESYLELLKYRAFGKGVEKTSLVARTFAELTRKHAIDVIEMEKSFGFCRSVIESVYVPVAVRMHGPRFLPELLGIVAMTLLFASARKWRARASVHHTDSPTLRERIANGFLESDSGIGRLMDSRRKQVGRMKQRVKTKLVV
jgi:hypothetical protein